MKERVEEREGEEVEKRKERLVVFCFFHSDTVTDEESIRPCVTRNKMLQENAASNKFSVILLANWILLATAFPFLPDSRASPCLTHARLRHPLLLISAPDISSSHFQCAALYVTVEIIKTMRDADVIGFEPTVCYQVCNMKHANSEVRCYSRGSKPRPPV